MQKKSTLKTIGLTAAAIGAGTSALVSFDHSFFQMVVLRRQGSGSVRKKWFTFKEMQVNHPRDKFADLYEAGKEWIGAQPVEDLFIRSDDGLKLHAIYMHTENPKRIAILCHGYRSSAAGDFANIAQYLHENDCDLLLIDQRSSGLSEGKYITFGAKEHKDILLWTQFVEERNPNKLPIFLYGISMGGTSVLLASGNDLPDSVKGLIVDCAFHSMRDELKQLAKNWFHLPNLPLLLMRTDYMCRKFADFSMKETDTTPALFKNRRPVLFFHGGKDTFVDLENGETNYALCAAPKELVIMEDARHLCCSYAEPKRYRMKVMEFFNKYGAEAPVE